MASQAGEESVPLQIVVSNDGTVQKAPSPVLPHAHGKTYFTSVGVAGTSNAFEMPGIAPAVDSLELRAVRGRSVEQLHIADQPQPVAHPNGQRMTNREKLIYLAQKPIFLALCIFLIASFGYLGVNVTNVASPYTFQPTLTIYQPTPIAGICFTLLYVIAYAMVMVGSERNPDPTMRFLNLFQSISFMTGFGLLTLSQICSLIPKIVFATNRTLPLMVINQTVMFGACFVVLGIILSMIIARMVRQQVAEQMRLAGPEALAQVSPTLIKIQKFGWLCDIIRYLGAASLIFASVISISSQDLVLIKQVGASLFVVVSISFIVTSVLGMTEYVLYQLQGK